MQEAALVCSDNGKEADLYRNLPLDSDSLSIRVLELLPGNHLQPVKCRLVVRQVHGFTQYEALSYTWGTSGSTRTIVVNDHTLAITENLECALRYLRRKTRWRRIWCDAICINQLDLQERGTQVMKMGQIYRNAAQVLVWLGEGSPETSLAFRYIYWCIHVKDGMFEKASQGCCPLHWRKREEIDLPGFVCPKCRIQCGCEDCIQKRENIRTGLADILARNWWRRMWVIQEVAMAAGDPIIGCGENWLAWSDLVEFENAGYYCWPGDRNPIVQIHGIRLDIKKPPRLRGLAEPLIYSSAVAAADDVFHWLRRTANFTAADARDKVYALLGMARNKRWREFRPDYTISVQNLQYELVSQMILSDKNLDILTLCRPRTQRQSPSSDVDIKPIFPTIEATWIPHFDVQGLPYLATMEHLAQASPLRTVMAGLSSLREPLIEGPPPVLIAEGVEVDSVSEISDELKELLRFEYMDPWDSIDILRSLYYWFPVWRAIDPAHLRTGDEIDSDTMVANAGKYLEDDQVSKMLDKSIGIRLKDLDRMPPGVEKDQLQAEVDADRKQMRVLNRDLLDRAKNTDVRQWVATLKSAMEGRGFFVTSQGLLGIGPVELEIGDIVTVFHGSSAAYALRPIDTSFTLVGSLFVDTPLDTLPWADLVPTKHSWSSQRVAAKTFGIR